MNSTKEYLESKYQESIIALGKANIITQSIEDKETQNVLDQILSSSEKSKGVFTVVLTSLVYKICYPEQDIRNHQANMDNGYSGRSFDSANITPFLKEKNSLRWLKVVG